MVSLIFVLGMMAGGLIALTVMAMLFMAKSADESGVAMSGDYPSLSRHEESREGLEPIIPCPAVTAG